MLKAMALPDLHLFVRDLRIYKFNNKLPNYIGIGIGIGVAFYTTQFLPLLR
jgi:hypothetical protein